MSKPQVKIIIAGSRGIPEADTILELNNCPWLKFADVIVSGGAGGVDRHGEKWAEQNNIRVVQYLADWKKYGKSAGPIRNSRMAQIAHGLVAIWDGSSRGTKSMIEQALWFGLRVKVVQMSSSSFFENKMLLQREADFNLIDLWAEIDNCHGYEFYRQEQF